MLDARYHLFYSIAIFLMLGFGILIGASYYGPVQVSRQTKVVQALAAETNTVVHERNEIKGRLDNDEAALAALRPALIHGKLAGKRVVLIQTGDYADATQAANVSLEEAGATVAATVVLTERWGGLTARQRAALSSVADAADPAAQDKALLAALASALVHGTGSAPVNAAVLDTLQQNGLLTLSGDLSQPCTLFVVIGGSSADSPGVSPDTALLNGFQSLPNAVTVAGCEPSSAVSSSIPAYQAAGIATIDCIDLPLGQIALPFALRGETGDYGIKPTAKLRLPDSLGGTGA
jgi:hypothetical protein